MISNRLRIGSMTLLMTTVLSEASQDQQIQQLSLVPCSCPECQKLVQTWSGSVAELEYARQQQLNHAAVQEVMKFKEETSRPLKTLYEQKIAQKKQLEDEYRELNQEVEEMRQEALAFKAVGRNGYTQQSDNPLGRLKSESDIFSD